MVAAKPLAPRPTCGQLKPSASVQLRPSRLGMLIAPTQRFGVGGAHAAASDYPGGAQGSELVVEFTLLGQPFVGLNGGPNFSPNEAVSFQVTTEDQAGTDRYWDAIVG